MIVRDEAAIIQRCLASAKPFLDYWVICDTGSKDHTKSIIKEFLRDIPGELWKDEWVDFGHNRSLALQRARGKADYLLLLNADEVLNAAVDFRDGLTADA